MFECKVCGYVCSRGSGHIKSKHDISTIEYLKIYEDIDVVVLYEEGKSAQQISNLIKQKNLGVNPIKKDILFYLKSCGVDIRTTSDAIKKWSFSRGGPWNKGLDKNTHSSIMKYADSRKGVDNPYYKSDDSSRERIKWWLNKTPQEVKTIRRKIADRLKQRYREGSLIPYSLQNSEWEQKRKISALLGYKKYLSSEKKHKFGNPSLAEREIASILEDKNIKYIKQFSISGKYSCDLYLPDHNAVIEYYGTYWHSDPRKYGKEYFNEKKNKTAQEIWDYDKKREEFITRNGYNLIIIWEQDYKFLNFEQKKDLIYETIASKSDNEDSN